MSTGFDKKRIDTRPVAYVTPAKRPNTQSDVLDLSKKTNGNDECTVKAQKDDDVILLSEDEDERLIDDICKEMEKENSPKNDVAKQSKALLRKIENELRNEESTLLLLQQLRANQKSHALQTKTTKPVTNGQVPQKMPQPTINLGRPTGSQISNRTGVANTITRSPAPQSNAHSAAPTAPKCTKAMAIQMLEQQCNAKKGVLRKQLERALDKVTLPRPAAGTGLSEVAFVPSTLTNEFTSLIGLEEVVRSIQEFDPNKSGKPEQKRIFSPFACVRCGTDFTPVWKRERPGSSDVVCEACIFEGQRSRLQKEYDASVKSALTQYSASEREVDRDLQEVVNNPTKLEAFMKEQEKKLLATHQAQLAAQQSAASLNSSSHARYHPTYQQQSAQSFTGTGGIRHSQSAGVLSTAANHLSGSNAGRRSSQVVGSTVSTTVPSHSTQGQTQQNAAAAAVQHLASQYQQLNKVSSPAVASQGQTVTTSNTAAANLMMAAAAASNPMFAAAAAAAAAVSNQQQQQQQQQRLVAAAAALTGLPQAQAQAAAATSSVDQFTQFAQLQAFLMNSIFCGAAAGGNQGIPAGRQQQQLLQQALLQYNYLLQQQQQQLQQQQQQQQAAVAAQAQQQQQQQQQAAALQQLMGNASANPAAYMTLLQNLWAFNAGGGAQQYGKK